METIGCISYFFSKQTFKSYYVVWKLILVGYYHALCSGLNRTMQYGNVFSSSEINKKKKGLNRTMQYGNHLLHRSPSREVEMFKSYYVVWKLCFLRVFLLFLDCLNRTMQYGNYSRPSRSRPQKKRFKSYYVVWKLIFFISTSRNRQNV